MVLKFNPTTGAGAEPGTDKVQQVSISPPLAVDDPITLCDSSDAVLSDDATEETGSVSEPDWYGQKCCKSYENLPVMPLPDLDETLDYWLESNEHHFGSEQLESIHQDIDAMRAPDSTTHQRDNPGKRHTQAERAAIITLSTVSFKRAMNTGKVESLRLLSNCDKAIIHDSSLNAPGARDHIAVLRKGRVFKVMLQDVAGKGVSISQLRD
ncbi:polyketide synthase [Fusarium heterosporum]|uniref:Polyketide synthase n=1 Tax=Fusarium heterosporum TaxID=42747 RepID=A0A8H5WUB3_FUSHE|nr:polyketide synthase [Fusarium heterosporum]